MSRYQFGLIGYPLSHSRSPQMHAAALAAYGWEGEYRLYAVAPEDGAEMRIANLVNQLRNSTLDGLNVTIPHKQRALGAADVLSPTAQAVGAVNTLSRLADGRILGENTDVHGFLRDLARHAVVPPGRALVLGAGGSARAVVYGLAQAGWHVTILARRAEQAAGLAASFPAFSIRSDALEPSTAGSAGAGVDLLVNTTPVGMHPNLQGCPWPGDVPLPGSALVYDLIYNPVETLLLQRARQQGLRAVCGAGMLAAQGALSFALWTGSEPPFDVMERALYQSLNQAETT